MHMGFYNMKINKTEQLLQNFLQNSKDKKITFTEWKAFALLSLKRGREDWYEQVMSQTPRNAHSSVFFSMIKQMTLVHPDKIAAQFTTLLRHIPFQFIGSSISLFHHALLNHASTWNLSSDDAEHVYQSWTILRYRAFFSVYEILPFWTSSKPQHPAKPLSIYARYALSGLIQVELDILKNSGMWPQILFPKEAIKGNQQEALRIDTWIERHPIWQDFFTPITLEHLKLEERIPKAFTQKMTPRL